MKRLATAFAITAALTAVSSQAEARGHHRHHYRSHHYVQESHRHYSSHYASEGSRPAGCGGIPWCGCYMAKLLGIGGALGRELNLAANWARMGTATSPHVGAIVVWRHHVGQIVGQQGGRWLIHSGNDGHAVRTRPRSIAGAIAIRDVAHGTASFSTSGRTRYASSERHHHYRHRVRYAHHRHHYYAQRMHRVIS